MDKIGPSEHRIVSLIPSGTEIVAALGYQAQLVGRSHECDFPDGAEALPVCCEPAIDVSGSSGEIDREVKARLGDALSIYRVDSARLAELEPTLILTQAQCEVCAVTLADVEQAVANRVSSRPRIVSLQPHSLAHIYRDIRQVAEAIGDAAAGVRLTQSMQHRLAAVASRSGRPSRRVRVACLEWLDPLMTAGNWIPELIKIAGGKSVLGEKGAHSPWVQWEDLIAANPERVILMPCGFTIQRTLDEADLVTRRPEWSQLQAVRAGDVFVADGHHYFNRPGPRIVETAEILGEVIDRVDGRGKHRGCGWIRLEDARAM